MRASIADICDPAPGRLQQAITTAKLRVNATPGFELDFARYVQLQCFSKDLDLKVVFRGLEVLEAITEEVKLLAVLRPFLGSSVPQIASKCVLILGRRCRSLNWVRNMMTESDDRIRANLIESLWKRREPEIEGIFESATLDRHHRVAANAVYGLSLLGSDKYLDGLDRLVTHRKPAFRGAAVWVIRSATTIESAARIKALIRDPDAGVRRAAFHALGFMREHLVDRSHPTSLGAAPS